MARSGSTDFGTRTLAVHDLITDAMRTIGALKPGETAQNSGDVLRAMRQLNYILKRDQTEGLALWLVEKGTVFLVKGQESYTLDASTDECASTYYKTEVKVAASATDVNIDVDTTANMTADDVIGIELDSGDIHWTTVSSVTDGDTVVIASGIPAGDSAAIDNHVYNYTTIMESPVRLVPGTIRLEAEDGTETPVLLISRQDYMALSDKSTQGTISQVYYKRQWNSGVLYTYPTANSTASVLHFDFERMVQDVDALTDDIDVPVEGFSYLTKQLAADLALSFGVDPNVAMMLKQEAMLEREAFFNFYSEQGSIYLQPGDLG